MFTCPSQDNQNFKINMIMFNFRLFEGYNNKTKFDDGRILILLCRLYSPSEFNPIQLVLSPNIFVFFRSQIYVGL